MPGSAIPSDAKSPVYIGKFCSIAPNVNIGPIEHPLKYSSTYPMSTFGFLPEQEYLPVKIGNDVWIGINAVILKGVTIGDGAVIASGAVVTKDVLPYTIVGGVPAKIIRFRFSEEIISELLRIKWWNWNTEKIKRNKNFFLTDLTTVESVKDLIIE